MRSITSHPHEPSFLFFLGRNTPWKKSPPNLPPKKLTCAAAFVATLFLFGSLLCIQLLFLHFTFFLGQYQLFNASFFTYTVTNVKQFCTAHIAPFYHFY